MEVNLKKDHALNTYCFQMVEVKPGMKSRFVESGELCAEFPYRAKALFAFEEVDGADICFFGMHVQVRIMLFKIAFYLIVFFSYNDWDIYIYLSLK